MFFWHRLSIPHEWTVYSLSTLSHLQLIFQTFLEPDSGIPDKHLPCRILSYLVRYYAQEVLSFIWLLLNGTTIALERRLCNSTCILLNVCSKLFSLCSSVFSISWNFLSILIFCSKVKNLHPRGIFSWLTCIGYPRPFSTVKLLFLFSNKVICVSTMLR